MPPALPGAAVAAAPGARTATTPADTNAAAVPTDTADSAAPTGDLRLRPGQRDFKRSNLALFAAGIATFVLLYSTQGLLPLLSADLNLTPGQASWTASAATLGLALALLPASALSDRYGRTAVMTGSVVAASVIALALPFAPGLGALVTLRVLQGAALAGLPATAMAYLAEEVHPSALASAMGLYVAGNSIGGMGGRLVSGWVGAGFGWRWGLAASALLALLAAAAFRLLIPAARHFRRTPVDARALSRTVSAHLHNPLLLRLYALGMLFMAVFGAVYNTVGFRLVAAPFHLPQSMAASIFVVYLVGTASSAGAGRLAARLGRRGALYVAIGLTAGGLLLSLADSLLGALLGLVLITAGFFVGHATASSSVGRTATHGRAQASALYLIAYYLGNSLGGTLGADAYHSVGWPGSATVGLAAMALAAAVTLYATWRATPSRRSPAAATLRT
ncbi:YNFM family putative membrane transporter [Kitasatospora sp. MAP12-15]|uniref:MFS transporter n=1 Tax=unclassified Kitasatospora TaxID=2633591 RepID=UPI002475EBCD|nr:MFS transporter [Kitasatospora sp. MAP12-44]MDH6110868.1 YNFM family putative membrane transporter [Kitasatospora sp. MAP12-44]